MLTHATGGRKPAPTPLRETTTFFKNTWEPFKSILREIPYSGKSSVSIFIGCGASLSQNTFLLNVLMLRAPPHTLTSISAGPMVRRRWG